MSTIKFDPTFKDRPLSWSQLSAFEWSPEEWYQRYVLRIKPENTPAMEFGNKVDKKLQEDPTWHPEIPRYESLQHKVNVKFGKIHMVAFFDTYVAPKKVPKFEARGYVTTVAMLDDYKTGVKAWTQDRADETGQLTMYGFMLWLRDKIKPEDVDFGIHWLATKENGDFSVSLVKDVKAKSFRTKRTMKQLLKFGQYINATVKKMEAYVNERKSRPGGLV